MSDHLTRFREFRERMNSRIMEVGPLETKRFFALDTRAYEGGTLDVPDEGTPRAGGVAGAPV